MASVQEIKKKKKGTAYKISVSVKDNNTGKYCRKSMTYYPESSGKKGRQEAEAAAAAFEKRFFKGAYYTGAKMTFEEAVEEWKASETTELSVRTREDYEAIVEKHLMPKFRKEKIDRINTHMCQQFIIDLTANGLSRETIKKIRFVFKSILSYCKRLKLIQENPIEDTKISKKRHVEKLHVFTQEQARRFLSDALNMEYKVQVPESSRIVQGKSYSVSAYEHKKPHIIADQWKICFSLLMVGGFREGELVALTWGDIDEETGRIHVSKSISKTKSQGQIVKGPKTDAGNRDVPVSPALIDCLMVWKEKQKAECRSLGTAWKGQSLRNFDKQNVFIKADGSRMDHDSPGKKFKKILVAYNKRVPDDLKLPEIRLHDLRHTCTSLLISSREADIESIAKVLGHKDKAVTLNIYGHALPGGDAIVARVLSEALLE